MHELSVDISIASLFSVAVWYFNIYQLPRRQYPAKPFGFFNCRLARTLLLGLPTILLGGRIYQLHFPYYHFRPMIAMFDFRGMLIKLAIYFFLHLTHQDYLNPQVGT